MTLLLNSFLKQIEIDSLKIRIPLNKVQIIDTKLNAHYLTINTDTAEEIEEFKNTSLSFKDKGISTRFLIGRMPIDNKGNTEEFLYILLNSKLLKDRYFEGITNNNIKLIYSELMNYKVVNFSFDSLEKAECTDTDFKIDQIIKQGPFKDLLTYCKDNTKESNQMNKGCKVFNQSTNKGIQWSERTTTATSTNPFIKIYHKETELKNNSKEFYNTYLKAQKVDDIVRTEFTLKNKNHFKALGINGNTLKDLLDLTQEFKQGILKKTMSSHINTEVKPKPRNKEEMSPTEIIMFGLITEQMTINTTYFKIRDRNLELIEHKQKKYRMKKQLDSIYERFIQGSKEDNTTQEVSNFLNTLGID